MYLKSLEVQGFKSFADRTIVHFNNDITAIVGPNGSGKSNISDAIRWVMGEMSSRELRGTKMEDVIFGGTQKRAAVGFAEATLTLDNSDGTFAMDTPEISITRRYYRSGESEYYINRQSARLRDINELFMDTGLGKEGYSNIGQGRIGEIVSLKSTDRRTIFEEAAGISKYRHRKEETERRLANTEDNLLRIGDKITELEMQVEPLREQAEKAKKYLTFRNELRGLEVTVWLDSLEKLGAAAQKAEQDYNAAALILEQQHGELNRLYAAAEQYNLQLNHMTLQADGRRDEISQMESQLQMQASDVSLLQANVRNNEDNLQRIRLEMEDQEKRSGGILDQIAAQQERINAIGKELDELRVVLQAAVADSEANARSDNESEQEIARLRAKSALLLTEISGSKAEMASITASVGEVLQRRQIIEDDMAAAVQRDSDVSAQAAVSAKALNEAKDNVCSAENAIQGYLLRQKTRVEKRDALQQKVDDLEIREKTVKSKIQMLQELVRDYEGFARPVKAVMQEAQSGKLAGVIGTVSSLIKTDDEYTVAIETALGGALQNIVVESDRDSKAGIRMLKQSGVGRATFLPLSMLRPKTLKEAGVEKCPGFVGVASSLVRYDRAYDVMVSYLLGTTVVCETLDAAAEMSKKYQSRFRVVTLDGQVVNAGGSMTGGSASKNAGILSRANSLERLEEECRVLAEKKAAARHELDEAARAADEVEFQMSAAQAQLREAQDAVLRLEGEQRQYDVLLGAIRDNIAGYEAELASLSARSGNDENRMQVLRSKIEAAEAQNAATELQLADLEKLHQQFGEKGEELHQRITDLKMKVAAGDAECETALENISRLRALSDEMQGDRNQKDDLVRKYEEENQNLQEKIRQGELLQEQTRVNIENKKQQLQEFLQERNGIEQLRTKADRESQEKNKDILNMEREAARLEQKKATTALEEKQIVDKLWDTYELTRSTAEPVAVEVESIAAANRRISELRRKISALGTPNLGAIDEFARVNERYEYLTTQRDDVLHSKKELEEIVRTITNEMKEIFVREFARINTYFGETFVEMFGGGKASLELEDPDEPLTTGIEIKVQPPGKQLKTITLLSGGEKAFVAIALYFAILKVRPASFCLLDEIDAALDDRNVDRFAGYLRNLSDKTQFIVITHRRGTMEASDALYGVTMQEHGISKILHMDLNDVQQKLGIED